MVTKQLKMWLFFILLSIPVFTFGTTLFDAAADDDVSFIKSYSGDINARDPDGKTALMFAADKGQPKAFAALMEAGANVNAKDKEGITALMYAAENGQPDIVKSLIKAKAVSTPQMRMERRL